MFVTFGPHVPSPQQPASDPGGSEVHPSSLQWHAVGDGAGPDVVDGTALVVGVAEVVVVKSSSYSLSPSKPTAPEVTAVSGTVVCAAVLISEPRISGLIMCAFAYELGA